MKTTKIQEIDVPKVALGTWSWGFGGIAGGDSIFGNKLGKDELKPVFDRAMDLGLKLWDTATVYASGQSETILGEFVKDRSDAIISTKFTPELAEGRGDNAIFEFLDESLERLNKKVIDIYWIHNTKDMEKWAPKLVDVLKSGKVKKVGVSNHNLEQIKYVNNILKEAGFQLHAIQNHFSLLYRTIETTGILDYCKENNIAVFSYMVLEQGALSGKYIKENPLPAGTRRGEAFPPETLAKLEPIPEIATAWAIAKGTIPIIGVTKPNQVDDAKRAASVELSDEDVELMDRMAIGTGVTVKGEWESSM